MAKNNGLINSSLAAYFLSLHYLGKFSKLSEKTESLSNYCKTKICNLKSKRLLFESVFGKKHFSGVFA